MSNANSSQQRILKIVEFLFNDVVKGFRPTQIKDYVGCSASAVTRDLSVLEKAGWAEKIERLGTWRLSPFMMRMSLKGLASIEAAERHIEETRNRFTTDV